MSMHANLARTQWEIKENHLITTTPRKLALRVSLSPRRVTAKRKCSHGGAQDYIMCDGGLCAKLVSSSAKLALSHVGV